uniref:Uncharacterized protein n=1 Tax=Anguilla anguilla TaxID=7936 RepID=A0A0E9PX38_ANGAN
MTDKNSSSRQAQSMGSDYIQYNFQPAFQIS